MADLFRYNLKLQGEKLVLVFSFFVLINLRLLRLKNV